MVAISGGMVACKSKNSNLSIFLKQSASVFVYPFYTLFVDFCFIMRPKVDWLAMRIWYKSVIPLVSLQERTKPRAYGPHLYLL